MKEKRELETSRDEGAGDPKDQEEMRRLDGVTEGPQAVAVSTGSTGGPGPSKAALDDWEAPNADRMQKTGGEAVSLPLPIPSPKETPPGQAIDPAVDEQLKRRDEKDASDIASTDGK